MTPKQCKETGPILLPRYPLTYVNLHAKYGINQIKIFKVIMRIARVPRIAKNANVLTLWPIYEKLAVIFDLVIQKCLLCDEVLLP